MSKSVLVMDTPKYCALCVLRSGVHHPFCRVNNRDITDLSIRPDWCPLMDLPEKDNGDYPANTFDAGFVEGWNQCIDEIQEVKQMIDLEKKCVLVRTHEEYENVLKVAKEQEYRWYGVKEAYPYPFEEQRIPDILKFYSNKELARNASLESGYELVEISEIFEDEEKIKDAVKLVRTFAEYPDRTALTDSFIESLKLLADTVESQMEEVK